MTYLKVDLGLVQDSFGKVASMTHAGMAHFANTGPLGTTCSQCVYWRGTGRKLNPCGKTRQMTGSIGPKVPGTAWSCKYFDALQAHKSERDE